MPCGGGSPVPAGSGVASAAKLRASAGTPSWSSIAAMLPGMNGCSTVATGRSTSASTRSTAAIRTGSVFAAPKAPAGRCRRWRQRITRQASSNASP